MTDAARTPDGPVHLSRRSAVGAALGLSAAAALSASPTSAAMLDPRNADDLRQIYRKVRYRTDNGLIFAWVKGPHLGEIGADLTPMYGINLGAIQRVTQRADGGFDVRALEISFTTDGETGKRLTEYKNPITKEVLPVVLRRPRPSLIRFSRDNDLHVAPTYQGAKFEMIRYPVFVYETRDDLFLRDRTRAHLSGSPQSERTLNEISTFTAPRSVALDPRVTSVNSKLQSNDIMSWPAWLKMGSTPGMIALYGLGGKVSTFSELPHDFLEMLHEVWPDIATDPTAALDAPLGD
jgi:hypothetical protein